LERDDTRPKRDLRRVEGGAAHSEAQGRRDESVPSGGDTTIQRGVGETDRG